MPKIDDEVRFHRTVKPVFNFVFLAGDDSETVYPHGQEGSRLGYTLYEGRAVESRYTIPKGQDFASRATPWEQRHSTLLHGDGAGSAHPLFDKNGFIHAHYGKFHAQDVFATGSFGEVTPGNLAEIVARGGIFVEAGLRGEAKSKDKPLRGVWSTINRGQQALQRAAGRSPLIQWEAFCYLVVSPEGEVLAVPRIKSRQGDMAPALDPMDLVDVPRAVIMITGKVAAKVLVNSLARRSVNRALTAGAARELKEIATSEGDEIVDALVDGVGRRTVSFARRVKRKVDQAAMMMWEALGGHALQRHSPAITRKQLLQRIAKGEPLPGPQPKKGGGSTEDFRVWRGKDEDAASKWASADVMHDCIGDVIGKNIDAIRQAVRNGGEFKLENVAMGRKTGEGFVKAGSKKPKLTAGEIAAGVDPNSKLGMAADEIGAFYDGELTGMTIIIRRRDPAVVTKLREKGAAIDDEEWFVLTAFPDRVRGTASAPAA